MNRRQLFNSLAGSGCLMAAAQIALAADGSARVTGANTLQQQDYLDTDDGQLYFWTAGHGPNLLLIHQSSSSTEEFAGLVPLLADRYRLISLDLPGHGHSDDPTSEPTVDDYTTAVQRVLDHLAVTKTHVLGHHGGALAAMNLIAREPDRFGKAILSGTGGVRTPEENQAFIDSLMQNDTRVRLKTDFVTNTWNRYVEMMSDGADPADVLRPFISFLQARLKPYRAVLVNLKWDRREALSKLRGPVLLVQGDKDQYVHGQESLLDVIPNSERVTMPGCGTFMFYDKPDDCAAMVVKYLGTSS